MEVSSPDSEFHSSVVGLACHFAFYCLPSFNALDNPDASHSVS